MWIVASVVRALVVAEVLRRHLNRLGYRRGGADSEQDMPVPGPRWWVIVALVFAWALAVGRLVYGTGMTSLDCWAWLVGWVCFAAIGVWLAAVDLDVMRLPDCAQLLLAAILLPCGIVIALPHVWDLLLALGAGLACGFGFWIMHVLSRGELGLGDVKLVVTCGFWLGCASVTAIFLGLIVASLLALVWAVITRRRQFAFGPWLIAGTLIAGLVSL